MGYLQDLFGEVVGSGVGTFDGFRVLAFFICDCSMNGDAVDWSGITLAAVDLGLATGE
jgi:hypothetical protein